MYAIIQNGGYNYMSIGIAINDEQHSNKEL